MIKSLVTFLALAVAEADTFTSFTQDTVPRTVESLWATVDPAAEPLEVEVLREWKEDGITTRCIRYTVCTHGGVPCRVAAFYTFPDGLRKGPAFVWAHGGGQRAERKRGDYFARRGYATIDINWGGREIVGGLETNTDWGTLDPSQGPRFYPGALRPQVKLNLDPDEHTIDPVPSPRNANWFLLALAGRRAVTFLAQQPEVDPRRIGFTGYSMGGNITAYCAIDPRLRAVAPMVGGTGHLTRDFPGLPGSSRARQYRHPELFAATMDCAAYWPLVSCPVLFLNATNDFHGIFDWSFRCVDSLPHDDWNASYNLHYNHSLRSEQYAALNLFFDRHLKGSGPGLPRTAEAEMAVEPGAETATLTVTPDPARAADLVSVDVLYSHDPNPRVRFWNSALTIPARDTVTADLPVCPGLPLLAFANFTYRLPKPETAFEDGGRPAGTFTVTSALATHAPPEIRAGTLRAGAVRRPVFHDFTRDGLTGWGSNSQRNGLRTYRFQDPERAVPPKDAALAVHLGELPGPVAIRLRLSRNEWLFTDGAKEQFSVSRPVEAGTAVLRIARSDFLDKDKNPLPDWTNVTTFTLEVIDRESRRPVDLTRDKEPSMVRRIVWE